MMSTIFSSSMFVSNIIYNLDKKHDTYKNINKFDER